MNVPGLVADYLRRVGRPGDTALDAAYQYQWTVLRDMLARLDVILADEGIDPATAERVIRCMLYGSPSPADAELRMAEQARTVQLIQSQATPRPLTVDDVQRIADPAIRDAHLWNP